MTRIALLILILALSAPQPGYSPSEGWPSGKALVPKTSDGGYTPRGFDSLTFRQTPAEVRTRIVAEMVTALVNGTASWMPAKYGPDYLAMRIPKGTVVTICGAGGCWEDAVVVDYGPSGRLHPERIADIAVGRWERICGVSRSAGLCLVTVDVVGPLALPETDKEGS